MIIGKEVSKNAVTKGIIVLDDDGSDLLFCNGVDLAAADGTIPAEIDALAEGRYFKQFKVRDDNTNKIENRILEIQVEASDIDAAVTQFKARRQRHPNRDVVIDYEHQTLTGNEAPAAGWISDLNAITRNGIRIARATVSSWTERAKQYIKNKEYRYVSPVFGLNTIDKETGDVVPCIFKHLSLTNEPLIDDLAPIVAKHISQTILGKDTNMDELITWLRSFLGLPLSATAAEILAELNKLQDKIKSAIASGTVTAKEILTFFENAQAEIAAKADLIKVICAKDAGTIEEARVIYVAAKEAQTQLVAAKEELAALKAEKFNSAFDGVIGKAFTEGKILPTQKSDANWMDTQKQFAAKDMTAFTEFWAKQPKIAPTGGLPDPGDVAAKDDLTEEDKRVANKMGISEETLKKHNKKE